jgi:NADH-quinone oxidoreductase subunit A
VAGVEHSQYLFGWGAAAALIVVGVLFLLPLFVFRLLRPSRPNPTKEATYECGEQPIGDSWLRFNARFYVIALIFVLFDVEIVFMYPWAVVFGQIKPVSKPRIEFAAARPAASAAESARTTGAARDAEPSRAAEGAPALAGLEPDLADAMRDGLDVRYAFAEMVLFVAILLIGFAYLWRYGFLDWIRSVRGG